ncbi:carbonic anhydrase [Lentzea sp. NEAU-D13]|uniref:Carbonic anhydrase n=1 Tax=Lentzea alba TaxID=2714351 RepID=A0A7C9RY90_9PSEU|nr:carbonic anhydrase [Lentzea alba]NGY65026.1 carbonic anhydrase [Lentzea alba]
MPELTRRAFVGLSATALVTTPAANALPTNPRAAQDAWTRLLEGNSRFVEGRQIHPHATGHWREQLVDGQHPFACVLGCADSRVPPEIVFDDGLGDIFTIRAAGEVLDSSVIGSIEYAVEHLHVPLVVVLGHAGCGAVSATIDVVRGTSHVTGDISTLVRTIEPAVRATAPRADHREFLAACVAEQALRTTEVLQERSVIIRTAIAERALGLVAASYDLSSGRVVQLEKH